MLSASLSTLGAPGRRRSAGLAVAVALGLAAVTIGCAPEKPPSSPSKPEPPSQTFQDARVSRCPIASARPTREEHAARSKDILAIVEGNRDIMRRLLSQARERGDVVDSGCKTEKLSELTAAVRIVTQQRTVLSTALSEGDAMREANAQRQLDGECARAERLRDEASRCAVQP